MKWQDTEEITKNLLGGINIFIGTKSELKAKIFSYSDNNFGLVIEGLNVAKLMDSRKDPALHQALIDADIVHVDGLPIHWMLKLFGVQTCHFAGIDLFTEICANQNTSKEGIFLLGAKKDVVIETKNKLKSHFPNLRIVGALDGYFPRHKEPEIVQQILHQNSRFLFLGMPSPKKEMFMKRQKMHLKNVISLGVGGSFDVISGRIPRAPHFMRATGLEWLFRLFQEPRRLFKRYLITNTQFIFFFLRAYISFIIYKKIPNILELRK